MFEIRQALDSRDREEIFRFRYSIYVEHMRRKQVYADHAARRIEEPLDRSGHVFGAWCGRSLVGTARVNFARSGDIGYYDALYGMDFVKPHHPASTSITTKLMVSPEMRGTLIATALARALYDFACDEGIEYDFIDCNRPLVPFFLRLGYRHYSIDVEHPEYGIVTPMLLVTRDYDHLAEVGSPLIADDVAMRSAS
jgi:GNAT superfamily N-acetyltransferase